MNPIAQLSRREFLAAGAAWGAALQGARPRAAAAQTGDGSWAFVLLGDMHYDRHEHHDHDWVAQHQPADVAQIRDYCRVTERFTPRLLDEVRQTIETSPVPVRFVIQAGDLVEGLCGRPELARQQCEDALGAVAAAQLGVPFLLTKGNHDIAGPGAADAFDRVLLPFVGRQAGLELERASFTYEVGDWLFVFYDAYDRASLDWLEAEARKWPGRPFFFVAHPPVVPYNARANWHLFASATQAPQRARLLELLGRHRAIVLSGHLHKYAALTRGTGDGRITQLAVSSVIRDESPQRRHEREGLNAYGPELVELEPQFSPETLDVRRELLAAERPALAAYRYADIPGYAVVRVSRGGVSADIYTGLGRRLWRSDELLAAPGA